MGRQLLQLSIKSLKRRWREIVRACVATFLAVFFITGVLLFQDNMYKWQMASNKERFGDWIILETNTQIPNPNIENHPLLDGYSYAESAVKLYTPMWGMYGSYAGYMSPEFLEQSYIDVEEGRMPSAYNEIAIDWNTLLKMELKPELGQTVVLNYYEGNDENYFQNRRQEQFVLVGIMESYTDVWKKGKNLPGVLVTKERFDAFGSSGQIVYIHRFKGDIKTDDYKLVFDNIMEDSKSSASYNDYLYDYKPWGTESVYNYMYIVVMVIGIAAITYQLISYKNSRKKAYMIMRGIGAERVQITMITLMENVLILVVSGLLGIIMAALAGKVICSFIEADMGIVFYYVKWTVLLKGFLSIVIAVAVEQLVGKLLVLRDILKSVGSGVGRKKAENVIDIKKLEKVARKGHKINGKNVIRKISYRLTTANGFKQNAGVRIFSLAICVIIVFCSVKICNAYVEYVNNDKLPDYVGVQQIEDASYPAMMNGYVKFNKIDGLTLDESYKESPFIKDRHPADDVTYINSISFPTEEERQQIINNDQEYPYIRFSDGMYGRKILYGLGESKYSKGGNTHILQGVSKQFMDTIENVAGVEAVSYSAHESIRGWTWEGMSLSNMAADRMMMSGKLVPYCDTYPFVTEYHHPTEDLYARLSKYMDPNIADYDKFSRGEQILILVNTNPRDEYDESIKPGMNINYNYYSTDIQAPYNDILAQYDKKLKQSFTGKGANDIEDYKMYLKAVQNSDAYKEEMYGACASPEVAGVVYVTDEVKDDLEDLVVSFGYYTSIATTNLAQTLCDNQNKLVEMYIGEELPDTARCKLMYNRMSVKYDLSASFSATHNILANYGRENNVIFGSLAEEKEVYRTDLINGVLRYGITILAMLIINVLISAIISMNRLEERKERIRCLLRLGADKSRIRRICMIEAFRESLWCVITMPVVLLVQYILYTGEIRRM